MRIGGFGRVSCKKSDAIWLFLVINFPDGIWDICTAGNRFSSSFNFREGFSEIRNVLAKRPYKTSSQQRLLQNGFQLIAEFGRFCFALL